MREAFLGERKRKVNPCPRKVETQPRRLEGPQELAGLLGRQLLQVKRHFCFVFVCLSPDLTTLVLTHFCFM